MNEELCSTSDAAQLLGLSHDVVKSMVRAGTLVPEAVISRSALWRRTTLERWDALGRRPGDLPPSPRLNVYGLREIAHRFRVTDAAVKKWKLQGTLPEPTWRAAGLMLWDADALAAMMPECPGCGMFDVSGSTQVNGQPTRLLCSCGSSVAARPRTTADA